MVERFCAISAGELFPNTRLSTPGDRGRHSTWFLHGKASNIELASFANKMARRICKAIPIYRETRSKTALPVVGYEDIEERGM